MIKNPLTGQTILLSFDDGPMAGKTVRHTFLSDGGIEFQLVGGDPEAPPTRVDRCEVRRVNDEVISLSYLGDSGYTLTVVLDMSTQELVAYGSNDKSLTAQSGSFEVVDGAGSEVGAPAH